MQLRIAAHQNLVHDGAGGPVITCACAAVSGKSLAKKPVPENALVNPFAKPDLFLLCRPGAGAFKGDCRPAGPDNILVIADIAGNGTGGANKAPKIPSGIFAIVLDIEFFKCGLPCIERMRLIR